MGVSFVSVTSAGLLHSQLEFLGLHLGTELRLVLQRSPPVLPVLYVPGYRFFVMIWNTDEFHVMDLNPSLAVIIHPFFSSTIRGSRLKGVVNLLFFGCLTSPVSPGLISLGFVLSFKSAYALIFDFCPVSLSAIVFRVLCRVFCLANGAGDTSGRMVFLPFSASFGDTFVVVCGLARYCLRNLYSSCFQFFPSTTAGRTHFSRFGMKRSASPLALGQRG